MTFSEQSLVAKLKKLRPDQDSIQTVSQICLLYGKHYRKTVDIWAREYSARPADRLVLLYLANDVIQNSRKKGTEFTNEFGKVLPQCMKQLVGSADTKTKQSVARLVSIWQDRQIYAADFVAKLREAAQLQRSSGAKAKPTPSAPTLPTYAAAKSHPIAQLERQIAQAEAQAAITTQRVEAPLDVVRSCDEVTIAALRENGSLATLLPGVQEAKTALSAHLHAIQTELGLKESLAQDLKQRADAAAAAAASVKAKLATVTQQLAETEALVQTLTQATSSGPSAGGTAPVLARQGSGGFEPVPVQPAQASAADLFAQLRDVETQLSSMQPGTGVQSDGVTPNPEAHGAPTTSMSAPGVNASQVVPPQPAVLDAPQTSTSALITSVNQVPEQSQQNALPEASDVASVPDLFEQLAQVQRQLGGSADLPPQAVQEGAHGAQVSVNGVDGLQQTTIVNAPDTITGQATAKRQKTESTIAVEDPSHRPFDGQPSVNTWNDQLDMGFAVDP